MFLFAALGPSSCDSDDDNPGDPTPSKGGGGAAGGQQGKGGAPGGSAGQGASAGAAGSAGASGASGTAGAPGQLVTLTEGTTIAATASPDRQQLIIDLQGALWSLPAAGGPATRLTDPFLEPARPHWSPAGGLVTFQAFDGGTFHIWVMRPDGTELRQLTSGHGDDREPRFSPDGTRIAFSSDRAFAGSYDVWVADVASGELTRWTSAATDEYEPDWVPGGAEIAYAVGDGANATSVQASDAAGTIRTLVSAPAGFRLTSPSVSPDGTRVAYGQFPLGASAPSTLMVSGAQVGASVDVVPFTAHWLNDNELLHASDGKLRVADVGAATTREVPFEAKVQLAAPAAYPRKPRDFDAASARGAKGIVGPALSPDGTKVVFQALNQIWVMTIGAAPQPLTNDRYYKTDPSWSPDGAKVAFSSDKAGTQDLYVVDLASGTEQRVTSLPGAEVSSAWSPDGTKLAFQNETSPSSFTTATFTVDIASGEVRQVIGPMLSPSKPSWHASGATLAIAALKPYTRRFREGTSQIVTADVATGAIAYSEPAPFKSISTRGEDGPAYSPDGTAVAFVMESALWIKPVDAQGLPSGEAVRINDEVTDAPSWSGDSQTLLYLSNGKLRRVARQGGAPQDVALELPWAPEMPAGRTVIHAGKLWDGRGPDVLTDVDVVVDGHRITLIRPHDAGAPDGEGVTHVDASDRTVIPGLWESHTHQWVSGKAYGDRLGRLWLAYGVTSLSSLCDPAYRAVETREAFASGQRVGPRFFASGEAFDGERVFISFARPITGGEPQLARELARAKALDYDLLKTYVRLSHRESAQVTAFGHDDLGVVVTSHNMPPLVAYPQDGLAHVSAGTRMGFAYTRSSAGITYSDARDLLRGSGMFVISTTFTPSLYADDPTMVDDARFQLLNPPWEQAALKGKRDFAVNGNQTALLDRLTKEETTVQSLLQTGGAVLAGTDSPFDNVAAALHLNLRAQVKLGGLAPWQAMQTATKLAAEVGGVGNDLGTVEPGKLADLAFLDGDPLADIKDLDNVTAVMKNGRFYTINELVTPFQPATAKAAPAAKKNRVLPPAPGVATAAQKYWWHDPSRMIED